MALTEGVTRYIVKGWPTQGTPMQCAEAVKLGDLVGIDTNGYVFPVDSDDGEQGRGVAGAKGATGRFIPVYIGAIIGGFTGGTEAGAVYPSGTAGQWTETADVNSSDSDTIVGYVITETMILAIPAMRADSTA